MSTLYLCFTYFNCNIHIYVTCKCRTHVNKLCNVTSEENTSTNMWFKNVTPTQWFTNSMEQNSS